MGNPQKPSAAFSVYAAIDLRGGQVVRLRNGDPARQTTYDSDPASVARRWINAGAKWLHIINLDGALTSDASANQEAYRAILQEAKIARVKTQLGGGLRSLDQIGAALNLGINRVLLATAAVKQPFVLASALERWGTERIAVSLDAREGQAQIGGWTENSGQDALTLARWYDQIGLHWMVFTDVNRDGTGAGLDLDGALAFTQATGMNIIAAGGVTRLDEVRAARERGLSGVIVGRALYEGQIDPGELFALDQAGQPC